MGSLDIGTKLAIDIQNCGSFAYNGHARNLLVYTSYYCEQLQILIKNWHRVRTDRADKIRIGAYCCVFHNQQRGMCSTHAEFAFGRYTV